MATKKNTSKQTDTYILVGSGVYGGLDTDTGLTFETLRSRLSDIADENGFSNGDTFDDVAVVIRQRDAKVLTARVEQQEFNVVLE